MRTPRIVTDKGIDGTLHPRTLATAKNVVDRLARQRVRSLERGQRAEALLDRSYDVLAMQQGDPSMSKPKTRAEKSDASFNSDRQSENAVSLRIVEALGPDRDFAWLSRQTGISTSTLHGYRTGGIPKTEPAVLIAGALGVTLDWLLTGRGPTRIDQSAADFEKSDFSPQAYREDADSFEVVEVPVYDIEVSAGAGRDVLEGATPLFHWTFPADWAAANLGDVGAAQMFRVAGDSQWPELGDGDLILVDPKSRRAGDDLHVVRVGEALKVKRIVRDGSSVRLLSRNDLYADEVVELAGDENGFAIIGRAVCSIKLL